MSEAKLVKAQNKELESGASAAEAAIEAYSKAYKAFLNRAKTERETVAEAVTLAGRNGFRPFDPEKVLRPGDKVYQNNRGKALILAVIGAEGMEKGVSIVAAHADSPRLDLKPSPLYEKHDLAYFDTHYYGGIKKYQWTTVPLSLHGVVVLKDGTTLHICIGEDSEDPVFCITDLLPHLAVQQMKREGAELVKGEDLDILIGSRKLDGSEGDGAVKQNVLKLLHRKYGITEADFVSAELEAVPAYPARDLGLDRSMIGAYGQDDRVCVYPALTALFSLEKPVYTAVTVLADKEEVGSEGNTGALSSFVADFISDLAAPYGKEGRHVLSRSLCISADVIATLDPLYAEVTDLRNIAVLNGGVVVSKYRGLRGKAETNDSSAEFMAVIRRIFDESEVQWQIGEVGKVDVGGGRTLAKFIASRNVDTVDVGVPILSMHSPLEVTSKSDLYMAHRAFSAFFGRKA